MSTLPATSVSLRLSVKRSLLFVVAMLLWMTATIAAAQNSDISITNADAPDPVAAGSNLSYSITISSNGPVDAANASWTDPLPAGTTFVSLSPVAGWSCTTPAVGVGGTVSCTNALMISGAVDAFTLVVAVVPSTPSGTVLTNTATVTTTTTDPNPANNSATATTTVATSADVSITIVDAPDPVAAGANLTYSVVVSNAGPSNATSAVWGGTLPAATTFVSLSTSAGWSCTTPAVGATGAIACSNGSLVIGSSPFTLTVAVASATGAGTVLTQTVTTSSATTDPTPGNNSATTTTTTSAASADLSITVTDSPDPVAAGANLTYTVTMVNNGPSLAGTAAWSETLPASTKFVSITAAAGWTCTTPAVGATGAVSCSNASLAVGSSVFSLTVAVNSATAVGTVLSNTVAVTSVTTDPTPANNSATANTTVSAALPASIPLLTFDIAGMTGGLPQIINMAAGDGPAFMADLVRILSGALGQTLQFVEQNAQGSVILSGFNGGNVAFVPHSLQTGDTRADGVYPTGNGQYQIVRNGQSLVIAPALVRLDQLTALLPSVVGTLKDTGLIVATQNGVTYVLQPGVAVQLDTATGTARLAMGSDGYFHFIDTLGNNQVLYPAFAEPATLRSILLGMDANATLNIQMDATARITLNGQSSTLVPDLILGSVPTDRVGQTVWQESATRYRLLNTVTAPASQTTQGFGVR